MLANIGPNLADLGRHRQSFGQKLWPKLAEFDEPLNQHRQQMLRVSREHPPLPMHTNAAAPGAASASARRRMCATPPRRGRTSHTLRMHCSWPHTGEPSRARAMCVCVCVWRAMLAWPQPRTRGMMGRNCRTLDKSNFCVLWQTCSNESPEKGGGGGDGGSTPFQDLREFGARVSSGNRRFLRPYGGLGEPWRDPSRCAMPETLFHNASGLRAWSFGYFATSAAAAALPCCIIGARCFLHPPGSAISDLLAQHAFRVQVWPDSGNTYPKSRNFGRIRPELGTNSANIKHKLPDTAKQVPNLDQLRRTSPNFGRIRANVKLAPGSTLYVAHSAFQGNYCSTSLCGQGLTEMGPCLVDFRPQLAVSGPLLVNVEPTLADVRPNSTKFGATQTRPASASLRGMSNRLRPNVGDVDQSWPICANIGLRSTNCHIPRSGMRSEKRSVLRSTPGGAGDQVMSVVGQLRATKTRQRLAKSRRMPTSHDLSKLPVERLTNNCRGLRSAHRCTDVIRIAAELPHAAPLPPPGMGAASAGAGSAHFCESAAHLCDHFSEFGRWCAGKSCSRAGRGGNAEATT